MLFCTKIFFLKLIWRNQVRYLCSSVLLFRDGCVFLCRIWPWDQMLRGRRSRTPWRVSSPFCSTPRSNPMTKSASSCFTFSIRKRVSKLDFMQDWCINLIHRRLISLRLHTGIGEENLNKLIQHANVQQDRNIITSLQHLGCPIITGVRWFPNSTRFSTFLLFCRCTDAFHLFPAVSFRVLMPVRLCLIGKNVQNPRISSPDGHPSWKMWWRSENTE